jgi:hypothetical protein
MVLPIIKRRKLKTTHKNNKCEILLINSWARCHNKRIKFNLHTIMIAYRQDTRTNLQLPVQSVPITTKVVRSFVCYVCLMLVHATFNNISVISWQSVLLVEKTRVPGEHHWPAASHWQTLSHNVVHLALIEIRTHNISSDKHWLHW